MKILQKLMQEFIPPSKRRRILRLTQACKMLTFAQVLAFVLTAFLVEKNAGATTELEGAIGATSHASSWRGDYSGGATVRVGARFARVFATEFQSWQSYALVNQRLTTGLSLGVAGYLPLKDVSPYARLFAIHQHEESLVSVKKEPFGAAFGVGPGIRHRAGGGLSAGAEFPLKRITEKLTPCVVSNATVLWFPDHLGPTWYFGLDIGVGLDFLL